MEFKREESCVMEGQDEISPNPVARRRKFSLSNLSEGRVDCNFSHRTMRFQERDHCYSASSRARESLSMTT